MDQRPAQQYGHWKREPFPQNWRGQFGVPVKAAAIQRDLQWSPDPGLGRNCCAGGRLFGDFKVDDDGLPALDENRPLAAPGYTPSS